MAIPKRQTNALDIEAGKRIRIARMNKGLSQTELGKLCGGVTFQQIQKYEKGTNRCSASRLQQIAIACGVTPAFFFASHDNKPTNGDAALSDIVPLLQSRQAMTMAQLFGDISNPKVRTALVDLCASLAAQPAAASKRERRRAE